MRALIVGTERYGSLGQMCHDALTEIGVESHAFDYRREARIHGIGSQVPGLRRVMRLWKQYRMNQHLVRQAARIQPDVVLVLKGELISPSTLSAVNSRTQARLVNWNPDNPFNPLNTTPALLKSIPVYDLHFTWHQALADRLEKAGAPRVAYLPFGYDPRLHHPVELTSNERAALATDVCFCGTWEPKRERLLAHVTDFGLGIWGNGWENLALDSPLRACWRGPAIYGDDLSSVYSASRIVLNFLREQNRDAHNMRTFETPATGAFQLTTRSRQVAAWFTEGREIGCFESPQELARQVKYYLGHEAERRQVAQAGYQRLKRNTHTYAERMQRVMDEVARL